MEKNKCGAYEIYLLSVLTWVTLVIRWRRNIYGFCFNFFMSPVLRSITWKDVCVCRCAAFKCRGPAVLGAVALCAGVNTWAGLKLPVHWVRMHLLSPLSLISLWNYSHLPTCPSPLLHRSCGSTLSSGFGFCSDRIRDAPTDFSCIPWLGWLAPCCIPSLCPWCYTCSLSAFYFPSSAGSSVCQDHLIMDLCPLVFF